MLWGHSSRHAAAAIYSKCLTLKSGNVATGLVAASSYHERSLLRPAAAVAALVLLLDLCMPLRLRLLPHLVLALLSLLLLHVAAGVAVFDSAIACANLSADACCNISSKYP